MAVLEDIYLASASDTVSLVLNSSTNRLPSLLSNTDPCHMRMQYHVMIGSHNMHTPTYTSECHITPL